MKMSILKLVLILMLFSSGTKSIAQKVINLDEAITLASQGNKALKIQNLEQLRAKHAVKDVKSLWMPNVSLNGNISRYFDRQVIFVPGSFAGTEKDVQDLSVGGLYQYNGAITFNQTIFSIKSNQEIKASLVEEEIEKERTIDLEGRLILEVTRAYYQVLLAQNQLGLIEKSLERNAKELNDSKSLFLNGKGLKIDTLRSYIAVENLKTSVSYQENAIQIAKLQLKQLIGFDEETELLLVDNLIIDENDEELYNVNDEIMIEQLNRQDLKIQKLNIKLEEKKLASIKATRSPELNLIGQYQIQSQTDGEKFKDQSWHNTSFVGVNLNIPIFTGGRSSSKIKQSQLKLEQQKIKMDDLYDYVRLELNTILNNWNNAKLQYETQKRTVEAERANYIMHNQRYNNGIGSKLELTDAEFALSSSELNLLQAMYNLKLSRVELQWAMGQLSI